jgi:hypothetical protein
VESGSADVVGVVHEDRLTAFGKWAVVNPAVVDRTLRESLGGIRDREAFDGAVASLPYNEVIARYADEDYADRLFAHYSSLSSVPVVEIRDLGIENSRSGLMFSGVSFRNVPAVLPEAIDAFVLLDAEDSGRDGKSRGLLDRIALESARMGIDMTELRRAYEAKPVAEVQDFLTAYYVYLRDSNGQFGSIYDRFFETVGETEKVRLSSRLEGLSVVKLKNWYMLPQDFLFSEFGLIDLGDGLYHHATYDSVDELYGLVQASDASVSDVQSLHHRVRRMAAHEDMSHAGENAQEKAEALVLLRMIYGHPKVVREVNVANERARYDAYTGNWYDTTYAFPQAFYRFMLEEKVKGTALYADVLSHFRLSPDIELLDTDARSIMDVEELMPAGSMKRDLANYARISRSPTLANLFVPSSSRVGSDTTDFRLYLYANNPQLLPGFEGVYTEHADGSVSVENGTDDFIRVNGNVMMLRSTEGHVSTYRSVGMSGFERTNIRDFSGLHVEGGSIAGGVESAGERLATGKKLNRGHVAGFE